jgi:hypothetical protein
VDLQQKKRTIVRNTLRMYNTIEAMTYSATVVLFAVANDYNEERRRKTNKDSVAASRVGHGRDSNTIG